MVVIDAVNHLGGACLNQGTIPSKTLREAILDLTGFRNRSYYGSAEEASDISINDLNFRLHKVIEDQNALIARQFAKNDIECVHGFGRFFSDECIEVVDRSGEILETICADRFLVATGRGAQSEGVPFDGKVVLDSNSILNLDYLPESMLVLGGASSGSRDDVCRAGCAGHDGRPRRAPIALLDTGIAQWASISSRWASSCKCSERLRKYATAKTD